MSHLAGGTENRAQCAHRGQRETVVGRLAVDEEAAAPGHHVGNLGPGRVALLATDKQHANSVSHYPQKFGGGQLRGQNAFGVAYPAAIQKVFVLAELNVGRHGVHVRGKHHIRLLICLARIDVPALPGIGALRRLRNRCLFHRPTAHHKIIGEKIA